MAIRRQAIATALLLASVLSGTAAALEWSPSEAAGRELYRSGRSAGEATPMARVGSGGALLPASALPCANCHGRDGRGRAEGGIRPPDITWRELAKPYGHLHDRGRSHPAFDSASFARALAEGIDPLGNRLDPAMPRYVLPARDVAALEAYLKRIHEDHAPGVSDSTLRIGTLLPARGALAAFGLGAQAVIAEELERINRDGGIHGRRLELVVRDAGATPAETEAALRALADEDVFALLAPLAPQREALLAELAQRRGLPVVGPLSVDSAGDPGEFVFRILAGPSEQFLALAQFAVTRLALANPSACIVAPAETAALAERLAGRLAQLGWQQLRRLEYPEDRFEAQHIVAELAASGAQVVFYLGRGGDFDALLASAEAHLIRPYFLGAASHIAGAAIAAPPGFSERIFLAYPSLPSDWRGQARADHEAGRHTPLTVAALSAVRLFAEGLKRSGRALDREALVSALEGIHEFDTGLTPALSFGPGQRTGAAGAHVVTVELGARRFVPTGAFLRLGAEDRR